LVCGFASAFATSDTEVVSYLYALTVSTIRSSRKPSPHSPNLKASPPKIIGVLSSSATRFRPCHRTNDRLNACRTMGRRFGAVALSDRNRVSQPRDVVDLRILMSAIVTWALDSAVIGLDQAPLVMTPIYPRAQGSCSSSFHAKNHACHGNKRLAWICTVCFVI